MTSRTHEHTLKQTDRQKNVIQFSPHGHTGVIIYAALSFLLLVIFGKAVANHSQAASLLGEHSSVVLNYNTNCNTY